MSWALVVLPVVIPLCTFVHALLFPCTGFFLLPFTLLQTIYENDTLKIRHFERYLADSNKLDQPFCAWRCALFVNASIIISRAPIDIITDVIAFIHKYYASIFGLVRRRTRVKRISMTEDMEGHVF